MPKDRDKDKEKDEVRDEDLDDDRVGDDDEEEDEELDDEDADEEDVDEEDADEDEGADEDEEDEEDVEDEGEAGPPEEDEEEEERAAEVERRKARRKRAARRRAKPRAEAESDEEEEAEEERPRRRRRSARRTEGRASERRRRRREVADEPRRTSKKRGAVVPSKRRRKERKEPEVIEVVEPERPPEHEVDLGADLEPAWEPGVTVGGGVGLVAVAFAVVALMTSGGTVSAISIFGLVILLLAIAAGCIGVLARKSWGYVLGLGGVGLGTIGGLLWTLYSVVSTDLSPWWPLGFLLSNAIATFALFQMRWGPGPFADERERLRSLKLRTAKHTTVSGELALSGSIAAVLASVLCGLLLMGADSGGSGASAAARFTDGMDLEPLTGAPETGALVLARWGNEDYYFLGRVEQSRADDEFHVAYLDGDRAWVRLTDLRQDAIQAGASVHVHVQGHDGWLPAVVTQRSGSRIEAEVGNDQRVWVELGMVRVREAL